MKKTKEGQQCCGICTHWNRTHVPFGEDAKDNLKLHVGICERLYDQEKTEQAGGEVPFYYYKASRECPLYKERAKCGECGSFEGTAIEGLGWCTHDECTVYPNAPSCDDFEATRTCKECQLFGQNTNAYIANVQLIASSFENPVWEFRKDAFSFHAEVKDTEFFEKVAASKISFSADSLFRVRLTKDKAKYTIEKVFAHFTPYIYTEYEVCNEDC